MRLTRRTLVASSAPDATRATTILIVTDDDPTWWTAGQVAKYLGVHRATVARISREDLPYAEHGGRRTRRYDPGAIRAFKALHDTSSDASLAGLLAEHSRRLDAHDAELQAIRDRLGEGP